ncbi:MAG: RelA/SpoT family protein [Saezia sp.]
MQNSSVQAQDLVNSAPSRAAFALLQQKISYLSTEETALLTAAYRFADQAHAGQFRSSGEPYITHPIAVASICADWKLDVHTLMAALLHDTIEDSGVSKESVAERFGIETADIVDGVTKLDKVKFNTKEEGQAESFRKMLIAMARDIRVLLVKLADRTHNMRTLDGLRPDKQRRIGQETMEIYAPLASLLGINHLYRELQDLAFKSIWPWRASILKKALDNTKDLRVNMFQQIYTNILTSLKQPGLSPEINSWQKNLYSIYCKMDERQLTYAQVMDQFNFCIIVNSLEDCYRALGILHQLYRPLMNRFKDYIAIQKNNGYQSLHTSVIGPANTTINVQIRTEKMNRIAEYGVTAFWLYDMGKEDHAALEAKWVQGLMDIQEETRDSKEFLSHVKGDLGSNSIYVFTPKSRIITLPQGSTTVDFAYAIHSDVGDRCVAVNVNSAEVPLRTALNNGDVVEIITSPTAHPNPAWLTFVRTGRARTRIRAHLKTLEFDASVAIGQKILTQSLRAEGIPILPPYEGDGTAIWDKLIRYAASHSREELLSDIGLGKRVPHLLAKQLVAYLGEKGIKPDLILLSMGKFVDSEETYKPTVLLLNGNEESSIKYARCCYPIPGDPIIGYLEHGEGLRIHITDCGLMQQLQRKNPERTVHVGWADEPLRLFEAGIWVTVNSRIGMLVRITKALSNIDVDIVRIDMNEGSITGPNTFRISIFVRDRNHLATALKTLRRDPMVLKAGRVKPILNEEQILKL